MATATCTSLWVSTPTIMSNDVDAPDACRMGPSSLVVGTPPPSETDRTATRLWPGSYQVTTRSEGGARGATQHQIDRSHARQHACPIMSQTLAGVTPGLLSQSHYESDPDQDGPRPIIAVPLSLTVYTRNWETPG